MTLALYGKSRRRQGMLVMLGLFAVFAALIGGTVLQQYDAARAATTGQLVPIENGYNTQWTSSSGSGKQYTRLTEAACSVGDTTYISTSTATYRSAVDLDDPRPGLAPEDIGLEPRAGVAVGDHDRIVRAQAARIQKIGVDRDRADIVRTSRGNACAVNLPEKYLSLHGRIPPNRRSGK